MDKMTIHDAGGTSNSQGSNDIQDEQEGVSSGAQDQDRKSYLCGKCGSRRKAHRCPGMRKGRAKRIPNKMSSPLSSPGPSPSPEVLEKADTSEGLETQGEFHLRHRHGKVEITDTQTMVPPSQPISKGRTLKVTFTMSQVPAVEEVGPMPENLMAIQEAPKTTKDLLTTGILAGFPVRYIRAGKVQLTGRIDNTGVVCDCKRCEGNKTVTLYAFESHAGSKARSAKNLIYIDNGKNLHEVMEAGRTAAAHGRNVSRALHKAIGPDRENNLNLGSQSMPHEGDEEEITSDRELKAFVPVDDSAKEMAAMSSTNLASASSPQILPNVAAAAEFTSSLSNITGLNILSKKRKEDGEMKLGPLIPVDYCSTKMSATSTPDLASSSSPLVSSNVTAAAESPSRLSNITGSNILSNTTMEDGDKKLGPLVVVNYSSMNMSTPNLVCATPPQVSSKVAPASDLASSLSNITGSNKEDDGDRDKDQEKDHGVDKTQVHDPDYLLNAKREIIRELPVDKEQLFTYPVNWDIYDKSCFNDSMEHWIAILLTEVLGETFLGEENILFDALKALILSNIGKHVPATDLLNCLKTFFPTKDADALFCRLWRRMIFEIRLIETGLNKTGVPVSLAESAPSYESSPSKESPPSEKHS